LKTRFSLAFSLAAFSLAAFSLAKVNLRARA